MKVGIWPAMERALESEDGMGLLWYAKKKYNDFIFKIDWKVKRITDNSGVFVRFSDPGNDSWIAVNTGYEIQIDDLASTITTQSCVLTFLIFSQSADLIPWLTRRNLWSFR